MMFIDFIRIKKIIKLFNRSVLKERIFIYIKTNSKNVSSL